MSGNREIPFPERRLKSAAAAAKLFYHPDASCATAKPSCFAPEAGLPREMWPFPARAGSQNTVHKLFRNFRNRLLQRHNIVTIPEYSNNQIVT